MRFYLIESTANLLFIERAHTITEAREAFGTAAKRNSIGEISNIQPISDFQAGQLLVEENLGAWRFKNRWEIRGKVHGISLR